MPQLVIPAPVILLFGCDSGDKSGSGARVVDGPNGCNGIAKKNDGSRRTKKSSTTSPPLRRF